jgi:hypothetical protein
MRLKRIIVVGIFVVVTGAIFIYMNISFKYPVNEACQQIRKFGLQHKHFPTADELKSMNIPEVKLFSILKYRKVDGDFLLYFCPTRLGPCEVCTAKDGPYFDEI